MAQTNSRFFSLMVVGENPNEIIKKYGSDFIVEPYVKYKYLNAKKYQDTAIKTLGALLDKSDTIGIDPQMKDALINRLNNLKKMSSFEYYRNLTDGMYYDEDGNAISEENPNAKYNTCRLGRNFALPLILMDGSESYSALVKNVNWDVMNGANKEPYERAWDMVVEGKEPQTEEDKSIFKAMGDKEAYFRNFKSKEDYVAYNTAYWNYAFADKDSWVDVDDCGDEQKWIREYYDRFIKTLNPDDLITIFECSINNG